MKKLLYLLPLIMLACSSSSESPVATPTTPVSSTTITLNTATTTVAVDAVVSATLTTNEPVDLIAVSKDNFVTQRYQTFITPTTSQTITLDFDKLGNNTVYFKVRNAKNEYVQKEFIFNVVRGTAIQITGVQVLSFLNINQTMDPEFAATDPNRLADVQLFFMKNKVDDNFTFPSFSSQLWYKSAIKMNQGDLTWNLTNEGVYANLTNGILGFSLADDDNGILQDLMQGPPFNVNLDFSPYLVSKPSTITFSYPSINLQFVLTVNWI